MYKRLIILTMTILLCVSNLKAADVWVEAEQFTHKGGWVVDQQFSDLMGSSYLMAHGMGVPVEDARTEVRIPSDGMYTVYVRTYNWTAPWFAGDGPGCFLLSVGKHRFDTVLGCKGQEWTWQKVGQLRLSSGNISLGLHDLTGFNGRVDAILLTTSLVPPPSDGIGLEQYRKEKSGRMPAETLDFDFVVVGGGVAGMCAAVAASRMGCKVALVNDRPVLGGNNSSEVRVHIGGYIEMEPNVGLGRMIREFGHTRMGNAQPAEYYEDERKQAFVDGEANVTLFANYHAFDVDMQGDIISGVRIRHIESAEEHLLKARWFADCTGDGTLGFLAGADYRMGREARGEYHESMAPETADSMTMGASVQWYALEQKRETTFPEFNYGITFTERNCERVSKGEWTWETGMNANQITDAERIRDYGLLVVFSNWSFLKNHLKGNNDYRRRSLSWVSYVMGKRESRRLMGDYILKQDDIDKDIYHEDASFVTTWSIDLHFPDLQNAKNFPRMPFKAATKHVYIHPYAVPYRCLYSRNVGNLFMAGRNISTTHVALGTTRVMRTTGMMGEVVGIAAGLCKKYDETPRGIYQHKLDELKVFMKKGMGKTDVPDNQKFNLPEKLLDKPRGLCQGMADRQGCFYQMQGDTLTVGNTCVERTFLWNGGNLIPLALADKQHGKMFRAVERHPMWSHAQMGVVKSGKLAHRTIAATPFSPSFLRIEVSFMEEQVEVKRTFDVYADSPAIYSEVAVRGIWPSDAQTSDVVLDRLHLAGKHWQVRSVAFHESTDNNNNLIDVKDAIIFGKMKCYGNLFLARNNADGYGFFILKESLCRPSGGSEPDFTADDSDFCITGMNLRDDELKKDVWTTLYGYAIGTFGAGPFDDLLALHTYQKKKRTLCSDRDEMVMMNTWGDRSLDTKVNENFCLRELDLCAQLGISHFQIDDGWQTGKSPNSGTGQGSFSDIWKRADYWKPDASKYPHGLASVVERGRQLGIKVGLWYNPSIQNEFADWRQDAEALLNLHRTYGIRYFKIDGVNIPSKRALLRLQQMLDSVAVSSGYQVMFNMDVTAGRRGGYFMLNRYGNIFLENRYTEWGNYFPYQTLRNLWQLSHYVPAEHFQIEFLNKWRNADKYDCCDVLAPSHYSMSYLFALTMAGQPLAWLEAQNLPEETFGELRPVIEKYRRVQHEFHEGVILPIGNEPDGYGWTGFHSVGDGGKGFLLVYRENCDSEKHTFNTCLPKGARIQLTPVFGSWPSSAQTVDEQGGVVVVLNEKNSFEMYRYEIL